MQSMLAWLNRQFGWTVAAALASATLVAAGTWTGGEGLFLCSNLAIYGSARRLSERDPEAHTGIRRTDNELGW